MATNIVFSGVSYSVPANSERGWGSSLSAYLISIASNTIQKTTTSFTLSVGDLDFGNAFGVKSTYFKSRSSGLSTTGILRLANNSDSIGWRNAANGADLLLLVNSSNRLAFDSVAIPTISSTDVFTNKSISGSTNTLSNIAASSLASTTGSGAVVLATGATMTSPAITTPTGIVKGDVGLGNVDNTSDATKNAASVTLTNKTILTPVIDDYQDINEESAPSTPASGKVRLYAKTDKKLYTKDSAGTELQVGASGSGEINAITTGSTDATGWSTGTGISAPTTDTANSPLSPVTPTSIAITGTAGVTIGSQTSAYGAIKSITMPTGLLNRKLKVEFYFTTPASSAGTWAVSVYQGSTRLALSTDSSGDTILPSSVTGGKFTAYFDTSSSTSYTVNIVQRTYTSSNTIYVTSVIVGPGIQPQGAVVGDWISYTPTGSWTSGVTYTGRYRRIGDSLNLRVKAVVTGTPSPAGALTINLPSGLTVDTTKMLSPAGEVYAQVGNARWANASGGFGVYTLLARFNSATSIGFNVLDDSTLGVQNAGAYSDTFPESASNGDIIEGEVLIPIAEWAGSGTVNLAQNDVEWVADDGTSDVFGPGGAAVPNVAFAVGSTTRDITFITPPQAGDKFDLEISQATGRPFVPVETIYPFFQGNNGTSNNVYGVAGYFTSATNYRIEFGNYGTKVDSSTANNGTASWATLFSGGAKFRVRKSSAGAAVGFGIVVPGVSSGLVSASGLPGRTDGGTVATGYVGEKISATFSAYTATTSEADVTGASISLTAGVWQIYYSVSANVTTSTTINAFTLGSVVLTNASNTKIGNSYRTFQVKNQVSGTTNDGVACLAACETVTPSATTTYKLRAIRNDGVAGGVFQIQASSVYESSFFAIRIA